MEESRKPKEKISDFVGIDKLELETDYVDNKGNVFDIYKYEDTNNDLYGISVRDDDGEVIDGENGFILKAGMSMLDLIKEMMDTVEVNIQDSYLKKGKRPRSKRVYAEIQSTDSPSHITWFKDLKTARRELENHIAAMTKVGDYEIFRDEKAADIKMHEGDVEITLYVPSGSEDIVDNDVEHVIIRPKKETVKEEINKMKKQKHYTTYGARFNNEQRKQLEDAGFYVYGLRAWDEGIGAQLEHRVIVNHLDDVVTDFKILSDDNDAFEPDFDEYIQKVGAVYDYDFFKPIIDKVLGKAEANESLNDTKTSASKTDVTHVMNKIKVIGKPVDKSDFWFYVYNKDVDKQKTYHVYEGTGDNLSIEDEKQGFVDYINYDSYKGVDGVGGLDAIDVINNYISGDDEDTLSEFEDDGGMVLLYNPYKNLTVKQICWKVLDMDDVPHPENLTAIILMTVSEINESLDDTKTSASKTDVTPVMNKINVYGSNSTHPHDKTDFWFYVYDDAVDKYNAYHVYEGTDDNLSIEDEKQGFVDCIKFDSYKDVHSNDSVLPLNAIVSYISGDDDTLSNFYDDSRMIPLYNPYINLTVQQICWKVLNKDGVPHPENVTAYIVYTYYDVWD